MTKFTTFFIISLLLIAVIGITGCTSDSNTQDAPVATPLSTVKPVSTVKVATPLSTIKPVSTVKVATPLPTVKENTNTATLGELNAAAKAKQYLRTMPFSQKGLIGQLEYGGFTTEEAEYGVAQSGADWNEQAALKAKQYLKTMPFSRKELLDQLEYEGFTTQQAEYGVQAVGY